MPEPEPQPAAEEPKTITVISRDSSLPNWLSAAGLILVAASLFWTKVAPGPGPTPTPEPPKPVPIVVQPVDSVLELNGVRLDADKTKLFCDVVNAGDGSFILTYQPVGKSKVVRKVVVSGDVKPIPPGPEPEPVPPPAPVVVPPLLKPAVDALKPYAAPRTALSKFYADFAGVLEFSDPNQLQTTAQVRDALVASLRQFVASGVMGSAPKIGEHIDAYIASQVPLDDGALDADKRTKLIAAYKTVAEVLK